MRENGYKCARYASFQVLYGKGRNLIPQDLWDEENTIELGFWQAYRRSRKHVRYVRLYGLKQLSHI